MRLPKKDQEMLAEAYNLVNEGVFDMFRKKPQQTQQQQEPQQAPQQQAPQQAQQAPQEQGQPSPAQQKTIDTLRSNNYKILEPVSDKNGLSQLFYRMDSKYNNVIKPPIYPAKYRSNVMVNINGDGTLLKMVKPPGEDTETELKIFRTPEEYFQWLETEGY